MCHGCQERTQTCHGSCDRYREEQAENVAAQQKSKETGMISGYIKDSVNKTRGSNGGLIRNYRPKGRR